MPENLNNFSFGTFSSFRINGQFDDDFMTVTAPLEAAFGIKISSGKFFIIRDDKAKMFTFCVGADNLLGTPL